MRETIKIKTTDPAHYGIYEVSSLFIQRDDVMNQHVSSSSYDRFHKNYRIIGILSNGEREIITSYDQQESAQKVIDEFEKNLLLKTEKVMIINN